MARYGPQGGTSRRWYVLLLCVVFTVEVEEEPGVYTLEMAVPSPTMLGGNDYQGGKNGGECMR